MSGALELEQDEGAAPPASEPSLEDRAKRMGWTPQEQFRGDPSRWVSAEEFIRRGEEELPIARERMRKADRMLEDTQKELRDSRAVMEEMRERLKKADERAYARARAELEEARTAAVQAADTAGFNTVEARIKALDAEHAAPAPAPKPPANTNGQALQPAPEIVDWVNKQAGWWNKNSMATDMAVRLQQRIATENPSLSIQDNLAEVEKRIRGAFPEEFPAARRDGPAAVSSSTNGAAPRKPSKLTFDQLPAEERGAARAAYAKFKKQMPSYTEDEYLANYEGV